uniref:Uncharacterized protein n=1 Tax=Eutreptiella gymnastica TaxID=73025 RepID=A0A7S4FSA6_9EUGL
MLGAPLVGGVARRGAGVSSQPVTHRGLFASASEQPSASVPGHSCPAMAHAVKRCSQLVAGVDKNKRGHANRDAAGPVHSGDAPGMPFCRGKGADRRQFTPLAHGVSTPHQPP